MKTLIMLSCIVAGSFAFPFKFKFKDGSAVYEAIAKTTSMIRKRDTSKIDPIGRAFRSVDLNNDGHITAYEFASHYSKTFRLRGNYSYVQWRHAFFASMPKLDTNGNNMLEIGEFRSIPYC
ncbi:Hypothetical predicted protein [Mytilus galloprovincialis]|uniref:EF-hand domain-containing protein n=1 Tax=Mytilus galloprovincialis TaxID=29158 RepID=A0A8B6FVB3_MYTGA|nr:Hypothetical predicted protein [Mytilus galloprovincialis]